MKKYLVLLVLIVAVLSIALTQREGSKPMPTEGKGIEFFEGTWQQTLDKANEEHKLVFVDAYTVWCGPCKYMANNVFTDAKVGEYFNQNFINYKFDMEKGEGPTFARKYTVNSYPSLIFISPEGKSVYFAEGIHQIDAFMKLAKDANEIFAKR